MTIIIIVVAGVLIMTLLSLIAMYGRLVRFRALIESYWADLDRHLQKRHVLVLKIVEISRQVSFVPEPFLEDLTRARSAAMEASSPSEKALTEDKLRKALRAILTASEGCESGIKDDKTFGLLISQMADLEQDIDRAVRYYNNTVRDYNATTDAFPSNIMAARFNFGKKELFSPALGVQRELEKGG